jgi:TrmH family RNA methyltransferase
LRIVLVDTEGSINLGMILRLSANFGAKEIFLVSSRTYNEEEILKYAVRASYLYSSIFRVSSLDEALSECDVRICTTAKAREEDVLRNNVPSTKLPELVSKYRKVCLVFGRESTGLTREELSKCDFSSTIPTSEEYPALNLANSVAIYLYELLSRSRSEKLGIEAAGRSQIEGAVSAFSGISSHVLKDPHKRERAERAFRQIAFRAAPSEREIKIVAHVLRRALRRIESCQSK